MADRITHNNNFILEHLTAIVADTYHKENSYTDVNNIKYIAREWLSSYFKSQEGPVANPEENSVDPIKECLSYIRSLTERGN
jgi:hypothetical protein